MSKNKHNSNVINKSFTEESYTCSKYMITTNTIKHENYTNVPNVLTTITKKHNSNLHEWPYIFNPA